MTWSQIGAITARGYVCGHCLLRVASDVGTTGPASYAVFFCPYCSKPTFFEGGRQVPGVAFGNAVDNLPADVASLYAESRNCVAVNAYTASVLACRKLLMNVAVSQGANGNQSFVAYVQYLADGGYVPPNARGWVDHIRAKGNEATHEIPPMSRADAEALITFAEMILKLVFDYPARVPPP